MHIRDLCYINSKNLNNEIEFDSYLYLDTGNITENLIDNIQVFQSKNKLPSRAKRMVSPGDIIISTVRPIQKHFGILHNPEENLLVSTGFAVLTPKKELVNGDYLYYYLTQEKLTNYFQMIAESSVSSYPSITPNIIGNVKIDLPSLEEQNKIIRDIRNLDKKIMNNLKLSSSLEEYSQLLFHKWFIDFNFPHEEGKPYRDNGGEMYEIDGQMIPVGWKKTSFGEMTKLNMGVSPSSNSYNNQKLGVPLLNGASDFNDGRIEPIQYTTEPKRICRSGELIFCIRGTIGHVTISDGEYAMGRGVASIVPNQHMINNIIYLRLKNMIDNISKRASGSIIKGLTKSDINGITLYLPEVDVISKFNNIINPINSKLEVLYKENLLLKETRDLLIRKLIK